MGNNSKFKAIQIYRQLHNKIGVMAKFNEVRMKILVSEIIARMFESHKDEIEEIIKEIKIRKS